MARKTGVTFVPIYDSVSEIVIQIKLERIGGIEVSILWRLWSQIVRWYHIKPALKALIRDVHKAPIWADRRDRDYRGVTGQQSPHRLENQIPLQNPECCKTTESPGPGKAAELNWSSFSHSSRFHRNSASGSFLCTAIHCTALHCNTLDCTALHFTALHCTVLHCTALHWTAMQRKVFLCTVLYWTNALHYNGLHCLDSGVMKTPALGRGGLQVEGSLVVIIFHSTLKNMKKLIDSWLYPKLSTVTGQSF